MRSLCQFRVSRAVRHSAFAATTIAAIACSEATAPVVPEKYIVTANRSTAATGDTLILKAQLADVNGHSVAKSGRRVGWFVGNGSGSFVSPMTVTDADGVATNYFIAGERANVTAQITVSDEDRLQGYAEPISVVAGEPKAYSVTTSTAAPVIGTTIHVTAQLTDKFGNVTPIAGRVVTWSLPDAGGYYYQIGVRANRQISARPNRLVAPSHRPRLSADAGTFASPTSTTNSQGIATVDFQVGTTINSTYVISADDGLGAVGSSQPIIVRPGPVAKFVVTIPVSDPPAGATILISASAADSYDNPISTSGTAVNWSVTGGGTLSSAASVTDGNGYATTRLTTTSTPGTSYTVTASSPQSTATGASPIITTLEQVSLASLASAFGSGSSCGIATNGKGWCWGAQGILPPRAVPGKPIGDQTVSALSNNSHSCAISASTVICWGPNDNGQLGDNTKTSRSTPAPISSSLSFAAVSTGGAHTCALATTGDIYCWGWSQDGRLGDGTAYTGLAPIKVGGTVSVTALSAGGGHTCAIATSGDAYCWGANYAGQLGNGSLTSASTPALVSGGFKFTAISAGDSHTCGITASGVYCWGDKTFGQIGDGLPGAHAVVPSAVKNSSNFVIVAAGGFHTCAIASGGNAYCWGDNTTGELGDLSFVQSHSSVPIAVAGGLTFKSIAVGGTGNLGDDYYYGPYASGHSCAITTDGVAYCWGFNGQGELGTAPLVSSSATPLKVDGQH